MLTSSLLLLAAQAVPIDETARARAIDTPQSWPVAIQRDLVTLGRVEWQMRRSSVDRCPKTAAAAGIVIDYAGAYNEGDRPLVRQETGLGNLPQIIAVAPGSPADMAGIRAGDEITALDGKTTREFLTAASDPALLADEIQDRISARKPSSEITFSIVRNDRQLAVPIRLAAVCSARFILKADDTISAHSDGEHVAVTTGIMAFAKGDDELALITGHELAHVIADGGRRTGLFGRRKIEDRADLLGAEIAHCAGFDVPRAVDFWTRFRKHDWLGFLRGPSHRSAGGREKRLRAVAPRLNCPGKS